MSGRAATEWRYEKLTWPEINDAVELGKVCILPCGAVEQHGPHLPLDVDLVCPVGIASGVGRQIPDKLLVLNPGDRIAVRAMRDAHVIVVGGAAMDGPRHIWWNFVSSRQDRIDAAKADWQAGRFPLVPGDTTEFIPLPER